MGQWSGDVSITLAAGIARRFNRLWQIHQPVVQSTIRVLHGTKPAEHEADSSQDGGLGEGGEPDVRVVHDGVVAPAAQGWAGAYTVCCLIAMTQ